MPYNETPMKGPTMDNRLYALEMRVRIAETHFDLIVAEFRLQEHLKKYYS